MTIHFFIDTSFPFGMAAAKRRLCYAKGLIAAGETVKVHVCKKTIEKNKKDENDRIEPCGEYQGINYNYICGKYISSNPIIKRIDWFWRDYIRSFFYILKNIKKGDIAYCYFYPIFLQVLVILACKIRGVKIVKETCEHPSSLGKKNFINKLLRRFEYYFIMPLYDGFIPISHDLDLFVKKYMNKKAKSIIVPILVDESICLDKNVSLKSPYEVPYILHTGTMLEQKDSISKIIKAFALYKKRYKSNVKLVFTGPQANQSCKYIPLMKELGVYNDIELLGMVKIKEIAILQRFASLSIIYKSDNLQTRNCFPTKLGEMLINRIPVITTTIGDANVYLKDGESAFIIDPDDEEKLVNDIHVLLTDTTRSKEIANKGWEIANRYFNPLYQGKRLSLFFRDL